MIRVAGIAIGGLGAAAALAWGVGFAVGQVSGVYDRGYKAGETAQREAGKSAVDKAQDALDKALAAAAARETAARATMEAEIAEIRRQANAVARPDSPALSHDLVRLRNEARSQRNALRPDPPIGAPPALSADPQT